MPDRSHRSRSTHLDRDGRPQGPADLLERNPLGNAFLLEQIGDADHVVDPSLLDTRLASDQTAPQWAAELEGQTADTLAELEALAEVNRGLLHRGQDGEVIAPRASGPEIEEAEPSYVPEPRGLASPVSMGRFSTAARQVAGNWTTGDPAVLSQLLLEAARQELSAHQVPLPDCLVTEISNDGQLEPAPWAIKLNPQIFTTANAAEAGPGTEEAAVVEAAEAADTVYHEARHAEQFFRVARLLAGRGLSARRINRDTEIRRDVCDEALQRPLGQGEDREAEEWHESIYGERGEYRAEVLDNLARVEPLLATVNRRSEEAGRLRSGGIIDEAALNRVYALQQRAAATCAAINAEYHALPEERDAWAVGGSINRAVHGI